MEDYLNTYTSTGSKLIHHPEAIVKAELNYGTPLTLQLAPTSLCNLNCDFCSNVNREIGKSLDIKYLKRFISELCDWGLKSVEITGGGDPTCYSNIEELINICLSNKLEIGLITNGILLKKSINPYLLDKLKWVRVSLNSLDYVDSIDLPEIKGTLGFSYVYNSRTSDETWIKLQEYADKYKAPYVRIVPNCQTTIEQQKENNIILAKLVSKLPKPFFYQPKVFEKPSVCKWGYFKPFVNYNGDVFRCSSVVLNDSSDRKFHEKFKWCNISKLVSKYERSMEEYDPVDCSHCVFCGQNKMIQSLTNLSGMENFI